jgi:hypothetical protein
MAIAPASEKYFWLSPVTKRDRCLLGCPGLREVAVRRHIGSENRSKPTFHGQDTPASNAERRDLHIVGQRRYRG